MEFSSKGEVKAGDIETDGSVEIVNKDLHIATLTKNVNFELEMTVGKGRGYVPAERHTKADHGIGMIVLDSLFSPVKKVNYHVEDTRVGQITDYDRLILEIWTNGGMDPKETLLYASNILQRHMDVFVNFGKLPEEEEDFEESKEEQELLDKLRMPVSELELSVRSSNCLREASIKTIGDLVKRTETDMLRYRNFGKKSLSEISGILKDMGLSFGMKIETEPSK